MSDANTMQMLETLNVAMTPRQPAGMTPSGLALSPDQMRLFVACSDANVVAVADISEERSRWRDSFLRAGIPPARACFRRPLVILNGAAESNREILAYRDGTLSVIDPLTDERSTATRKRP